MSEAGRFSPQEGQRSEKMERVKRAVITGATGAIGTALAGELAAGNIEVLVLTHKDSKRNCVIPKDPLICVRFCSLSGLGDFCPDTDDKFDIFYHLAWKGAAGSGRNDMYLQLENIKASLDAVKLAKRLGCHTFIGAGSQAEYGRQQQALRADTPAFPETGYGYAKLCAGQMTRDYAHQTGLRHIWTRILSVYGPNDGELSFISMLLRKLLKGERAQTTFGEQQWDYLYSKDAAAALKLLAEKGIDGKTYVIGSGRSRPLREYIYAVRDLIDPDLALGIGEASYASNQVMYLCADIEELTRDTGWKPSVDFLSGISECIKEWKAGRDD